MKRVYERSSADVIWPFEAADKPYVLVGGQKYGYASRTIVEPFPAYPHDVGLVRMTLMEVERAFSVKHRPIVYVLHFDTPAQTNGWADRSWDYGDEVPRPWEGSIVCAGKRIPPHPAVTRYLVAHEYGHHVEWEIERRRELEPGALDPVYAEARGFDLDAQPSYGGGNWHATLGELFANDFRILVAGVEPDYWPHPGFPRPERVKGLKRWWEEALA